MSLPYWRHIQPASYQEVDVLVVGAGVCGLSAGWELAARGLRTSIVERHHVGAGASSRNAGFLMRGMAENYAAAVASYGRERARMMWRWTEENLAIARERGVAGLGSYRQVGSCLLALEEGERRELEESRRMLAEDGFEVGWLDRHNDDAWVASGAVGGLVNPGDAQVNPWEMLGLLAAPLAGVIHEGQEAVSLAPGPAGRGVMVRTTGMLFLASRVLVCTNAYGALLIPGLRGRVTPNRGQMLAIEPEGAYRLDFSYYANRGHEYFRQTPDGTVVVGGRRLADEAGERTSDPEPGAVVQAALERFARERLGLRGPVVARWAGTMGFSGDGVPIIEPVRVEGVGDNLVWYCGGFTGHGMSLGARCARECVTLMLG